jgi:hypothetical protein
MAVAQRSHPQLAKLSPEVERHLREALEGSERHGYAQLTVEETEHYLATGELPEHVERWAASLDSRSTS